jgi:hypothetical protein
LDFDRRSGLFEIQFDRSDDDASYGVDNCLRNKTMKKTIMLASLVFAGINFLGACASEQPKPPALSTPPASPSAVPSTSPTGSPAASPAANKAEAMVGKWPGAEGTYLNVTKKGEKYSVEIANLDGPKTFEGTAKGEGIEFTRNGKTETIKRATGDETGMKWFAGKKDCLVVTKGSEGFCKP